MHYYQHHLGDYAKDTGHLSVTEHGAYRLLMDHYYSTEAALPTDLGQLYRIARATTGPEKAAVKRVAEEFFRNSDDKLSHRRIEAEITEYKRICARNSENGRSGGRPKKNPVGSQRVSSRLILGNPNETEAMIHDPVTSNHTISPAAAVADPRHFAITSAWAETYEKAAGESGTFSGQDVSALKSFLKGWKGTAAEFLDTAAQAIKAGRSNAYLKHCRLAGTIAGLCKAWTEVRAELANEKNPHGKSHRSTHAPGSLAVFRDAPEREDTSQKSGRLF